MKNIFLIIVGLMVVLFSLNILNKGQSHGSLSKSAQSTNRYLADIESPLLPVSATLGLASKSGLVIMAPFYGIKNGAIEARVQIHELEADRPWLFSFSPPNSHQDIGSVKILIINEGNDDLTFGCHRYVSDGRPALPSPESPPVVKTLRVRAHATSELYAGNFMVFQQIWRGFWVSNIKASGVSLLKLVIIPQEQERYFILNGKENYRMEFVRVTYAL